MIVPFSGYSNYLTKMLSIFESKFLFFLQLDPVSFSYTDTPKLSSKLHCNKYKKYWGLLAPLRKAPDVRTMTINPLSANPTKWSNTLKQFVRCCQRIV